MGYDIPVDHHAGPKSERIDTPLTRGEKLVTDEERAALSKPLGYVTRALDAADILQSMAATFRERNAIYGDNYKRVGDVMAALFPDGVMLKTQEDFNRWHLFELIIVKMTRFANSSLTHADSVHDMGTYCAMLESLTNADPVNQIGEF